MNKQDEALQKRHDERERLSQGISTNSVTKERQDLGEICVTVWKFPGEREKIQLTAIQEKARLWGQGYIVISMEAAKELHETLGKLLS